MSEIIQTVIVAIAVAAAALLLWRRLRRPGCDSCNSGCSGCPLSDSCRKKRP